MYKFLQFLFDLFYHVYVRARRYNFLVRDTFKKICPFIMFTFSGVARVFFGWASRPPGGPKWGRKWGKFEGKIRQFYQILRKHEEEELMPTRDGEAGYGSVYIIYKKKLWIEPDFHANKQQSLWWENYRFLGLLVHGS